MWRKTRKPNPGSKCVGVDPNRNWDAGFGGEILSSLQALEFALGFVSVEETKNMYEKKSLKIKNFETYPKNLHCKI